MVEYMKINEEVLGMIEGKQLDYQV